VPGSVVDVYFDYVSPFAYFIVAPLAAIAERTGALLRWKPIRIGDLSNFADGRMPYSPAKRIYVVKDAIRSGEFYGIPTRTPDPFPMRGELALRGGLVAQDRGIFPAYHRATFAAGWRDQRDIGDESVIASCAGLEGEDARSFLAAAGSDETGRRLDALAAEAESLGVFGVPTMVLEGELFWGNDRLAMLEWRLGQRVRQP